MVDYLGKDFAFIRWALPIADRLAPLQGLEIGKKAGLSQAIKYLNKPIDSMYLFTTL